MCAGTSPMVRHAIKMVSEGFKMTHHTNEKDPCVSTTEPLENHTTNDLIFTTGEWRSKAIATQIAELAIQGHAVHKLKDGGYLVCKYGYTHHASDFAALQCFARRLGVSNGF